STSVLACGALQGATQGSQAPAPWTVAFAARAGSSPIFPALRAVSAKHTRPSTREPAQHATSCFWTAHRRVPSSRPLCRRLGTHAFVEERTFTGALTTPRPVAMQLTACQS
ncbi:ESAG8, partial [Symbiodinium sp. CCMP2456]